MQKQQVLIFTEDRKIKRTSLPNAGGFLLDAKKVKAYLNFYKFYQEIEGLTSNPWDSKLFLFFTEHRALPLSPYEYYPAKELLAMTNEDTLAEEALQYAFATQPVSEAKGKLYDYTAIGILGMICTIIIITLAVATKTCMPASFGF